MQRGVVWVDVECPAVKEDTIIGNVAVALVDQITCQGGFATGGGSKEEGTLVIVGYCSSV